MEQATAECIIVSALILIFLPNLNPGPAAACITVHQRNIITTPPLDFPTPTIIPNPNERLGSNAVPATRIQFIITQNNYPSRSGGKGGGGHQGGLHSATTSKSFHP